MVRIRNNHFTGSKVIFLRLNSVLVVPINEENK